jgi:hypothetical protein
MPCKSLVADWTPNTFLMECIKLVLIVHVVVFATYISESSFANVAFVDGLGVSCIQVTSQKFWSGEYVFANVTTKWVELIDCSIASYVTMKFEMFLQLQ